MVALAMGVPRSSSGSSPGGVAGKAGCLRVGGRARGEYEYRSKISRGVYGANATAPFAAGGNTIIGNNSFGAVNGSNDDVSGFRGLARINLDARTQTAYGTLRAFVRLEVANRSGQGILRSGTQERYGTAFPGLGVDEFGRAQTFVNVDKAFVQFAGITAGRASSFYDFYAHDLEFVGLTSGSDVSSTNLFAYTATLGGGWSLTASMEDPTARRNPIFNVGGLFNLSGLTAPVIAATNSPGTGANVFVGSPPAVAPVGVTFDPVTGLPLVARFLDVAQRNGVPDGVVALRVDQPWGSAQISAAVHEYNVGQYVPNLGAAFINTGGQAFLPGAFLTPFGANTAGAGLLSPLAVGAPFAALPAAGAAGLLAAGGFQGAAASSALNLAGPQKRPDDKYGWAVQGGLKVNLPFIAAGDLLYLQAAYAKGPLSYSGAVVPIAGESNANSFTNRFVTNLDDAAVDAFGKLHLTKSWSVTGALLHYWTPEIRSAWFGSYAKVDYDNILRTGFGPAGVLPIVTGNNVTNFGNLYSVALSPTLRDYNVFVVGSNHVWSPVKDLDIGLETVYQGQVINKGRVVDQNKNVPLAAVNPVTGAIVPVGSAFNNNTGALVPVGSANSTPATIIFKSAKTDDQFVARIRVQRDF